MNAVKINTLEMENVKRIRAISLTPSESGLTVIGGNNNQGKTSVLDTIAWALGGDRYKPSNPMRDGSTIPPRIRVTLSNGLIVERSGKNSALKVTDPNGRKSGQQLLNSFVEELALDLPKFLEQNSKDKAATLLKVIGVGDQLQKLDLKEKELYDSRRMVGQIADQKKKYAQEMPFYPDAPNSPVSAMELIQRQQAILAINGENQRKRQMAEQLGYQYEQLQYKVRRLEEDLTAARKEYEAAAASLEIAKKSAEDLEDQSTAQIEQDLQNIEAINIKVRANNDREQAEQEAEYYSGKYAEMTNQIEQVRQDKRDLLTGSRLPLPGLSVEDGELTYQGKKWDCISGSDQLKVATAIVRALNPNCGFVLLDKLEQMDLAALREFGQWLQEQGLQAIATRVSTGPECSIIIEDGLVRGEPLPEISTPTWKAGVF